MLSTQRVDRRDSRKREKERKRERERERERDGGTKKRKEKEKRRQDGGQEIRERQTKWTFFFFSFLVSSVSFLFVFKEHESTEKAGGWWGLGPYGCPSKNERPSVFPQCQSKWRLMGTNLNDFGVLFDVGLERHQQVHVEGLQLQIVQRRTQKETTKKNNQDKRSKFEILLPCPLGFFLGFPRSAYRHEYSAGTNKKGFFFPPFNFCFPIEVKSMWEKS